MPVPGKLRLPPGPIMGLIVMCCLAFTLIFIIIYRSPYTHANLSPDGYDRTGIYYEGQPTPFTPIGLDNPSFANTGDPVQDGRALFFAFGCASCHGSNGQGGPVGKDLIGDSALKIKTKVREGPKEMPAFDPNVFTDADLQKVIAFLQSLGQ
jgi:Cytochrome C oxidase, cbb3-type, subunit III